MQNFRNNQTLYRREGCYNTMRQMPQTPEIPDGMLENMPLAMSYVPWQRWQNILEAEKGFHCGTIFRDLVKPFEHAGGGCR